MISLRTTLLSFCLCMVGLSAFSQNVTILPGGITPAQSGSYPRLSYDDIVALTSPQDGDIAYDVTFKCMRLYNGTKWVRLVSDQDLNIPSMTGWSAGGSGDDEGLGIATDSSGNVFVAGCFRNSAMFGDTTVISAGDIDIFVAKYSNSGILQWVQTAGGAGADASHDVAVDNNGNIYIVGSFETTANFSGTTLVSAGGSDIFVTMYNSSGILQWAQEGGGTDNDVSACVIIDSSNNAYIAGYFKYTSTFSGANLTSAGDTDVFFAKYNSIGVLQWIQRTGGANADVCQGIAVDNNGYIYLTGYSMGATTIGTTYFAGAGGSDIFISKYNPLTSSWVWSINGLSAGNDNGVAITTDDVGNIYLTGYFANTLNLAGTVLTTTGLPDIFVAKFDATPSLLWAVKAGGANHDVGHDILVDASGSVYVTGYFEEAASFGHINIASAGQTDIFITKYNSAGIVQWVQRSGDINNEYGDYGVDLSFDSNKNIYMTGFFQNTAKFGNANLTTTGGRDIFIARIKE